MLELYHHGTSVCAAKPRIAMFEKGLQWTGHYIDILKGEQFAPEYLKLNPKGVVPTLVHDGKVVRESTLIGEYLEEAFPEKPLRPADPYERLVMRTWGKRIDEEVFPATAVITFAISHRHAVLANPPDVLEEYINKMGPAQAERRRARLQKGMEDPDAAAALKVFVKFFADLDAALANKQWLAGGMFSLTEVNVIPFVNRMEMLETQGMWEGKHPHMTAWWKRIKARPFFEPMMLGFVPPPLRQLMTDKGKESWPKVKALLAA
jgi:ganglioside-induced differentiation-associated protein 1